MTLTWVLFILYLVFTSGLAWMGHKKTTDIKNFAVGDGAMHPAVVGVTLAASIASTATFVINPGFVYVHGMSALIHLGVAAGGGVIVGLVVMSFGFRRVGSSNGALTLPQWLGTRYKSQAMTVLFAAISLLSLTFVVLIVGGLSIVMQKTLGVGNVASLLIIIGFVFSYIFIGGTYAHAYTNTMQGLIMAVIAAIIVASGFGFLLDGESFAALATSSPNLMTAVNPESALFGSFFSVWIAGFVIGFAIVAQPHILVKALYVKDDKAVRDYLVVCIGVSLIFSALLLVGLYAHFAGIPAERFIDPSTGAFRQDLVMTVYVLETFSPTMVAVISVALMAAGMSTLDGILVAMSSIVANDLFLNIARNNVLRDKTDDQKAHIAHRAGQVMLIVLGVLTFLLALNPPKLLGIFGQLGVYGIVAAACVPIVMGIFVPSARAVTAFLAAGFGLATHLGLYAWAKTATAGGSSLNTWVVEHGVDWLFDTAAPQLGFLNPGVTAAYGIFASVGIAVVFHIATSWRSQRVANAVSVF